MNQVCMNMKSEMNVKIKTCKRIMKTEENRCTLLWVKSFEIEKTLFGGCLSFSVIETSKSDLQASIVLFVHSRNWDYFHQKKSNASRPKTLERQQPETFLERIVCSIQMPDRKKELFKAKGRSTWSTLALRRIEKRPLLKTSRNLWETGDVNRVRIAEIVNYFAVCCLGYGEFWWITSYSGVPDRTLLLPQYDYYIKWLFSGCIHIGFFGLQWITMPKTR